MDLLKIFYVCPRETVKALSLVDSFDEVVITIKLTNGEEREFSLDTEYFYSHFPEDSCLTENKKPFMSKLLDCLGYGGKIHASGSFVVVKKPTKLVKYKLIVRSY